MDWCSERFHECVEAQVLVHDNSSAVCRTGIERGSREEGGGVACFQISMFRQTIRQRVSDNNLNKTAHAPCFNSLHKHYPYNLPYCA